MAAITPGRRAAVEDVRPRLSRRSAPVHARERDRGQDGRHGGDDRGAEEAAAGAGGQRPAGLGGQPGRAGPGDRAERGQSDRAADLAGRAEHAGGEPGLPRRHAGQRGQRERHLGQPEAGVYQQGRQEQPQQVAVGGVDRRQPDQSGGGQHQADQREVAGAERADQPGAAAGGAHQHQ